MSARWKPLDRYSLRTACRCVVDADVQTIFENSGLGGLVFDPRSVGSTGEHTDSNSEDEGFFTVDFRDFWRDEVEEIVGV